MANIPRQAIIGGVAHALVYVNPRELDMLHRMRKGRKAKLVHGVPAFEEGNGDGDPDGGGSGIGSGPGAAAAGGMSGESGGGASNSGSGIGGDTGSEGSQSGSEPDQSMEGLLGERWGTQPDQSMTGTTPFGELAYGPEFSEEGVPTPEPTLGLPEEEEFSLRMPHLSQYPVDYMSYMAPYGTPGNPRITPGSLTASYIDFMATPSLGQRAATTGLGMLGSAAGGLIGGLIGPSQVSNAISISRTGEPHSMSPTQAEAAANQQSGATSGGGYVDLSLYGTGGGVLAPYMSQPASEETQRALRTGVSPALQRYNPVYWTRGRRS